jgi:hypothetical protein
MLSAIDLNELILGEAGLITQFHDGDGLDIKLLDQLYDHLEEYRTAWNERDEVPKEIVRQLMGVAIGLYQDLPLYENAKDRHYAPIVATLATSIELILSTNDNPEDGKLRDIVQINF